MPEPGSPFIAPADSVRVDVAGRVIEGWQEVNITRGLDRAAAGFHLKMPRSRRTSGPVGTNGALPVNLGSRVAVYIGDDLVITGHVDMISPRRSPEDHSITIDGRSLTADLVDCSAMNTPGQWVATPLIRIVEDLVAPFSLRVVSVGGVADQTIPNFEIEQGEKAFEAIERLARMGSVLVRDNPDGDLVLSRAGLDRAAVQLRHLDGPDGEPDPDNNVLESSAVISLANRFSEITVKGQDASSDTGFGANDTSPAATSRDDGVSRYRPLVVTAEGRAAVADCQRRANWEISRRVGKGQSVTSSVAGWRQGRGRAGQSGPSSLSSPLWQVNQIVSVHDAALGYFGDLLIVGVSWTLNEKSGQRTTLSLEPVEAYDPQPVIPPDLTPFAGLTDRFRDK